MLAFRAPASAATDPSRVHKTLRALLTLFCSSGVKSLERRVSFNGRSRCQTMRLSALTVTPNSVRRRQAPCHAQSPTISKPTTTNALPFNGKTLPCDGKTLPFDGKTLPCDGKAAVSLHTKPSVATRVVLFYSYAHAGSIPRPRHAL